MDNFDSPSGNFVEQLLDGGVDRLLALHLDGPGNVLAKLARGDAPIRQGCGFPEEVIEAGEDPAAHEFASRGGVWLPAANEKVVFAEDDQAEGRHSRRGGW